MAGDGRAGEGRAKRHFQSIGCVESLTPIARLRYPVLCLGEIQNKTKELRRSLS